MEIQHRPGKDHGNADALSRRPDTGTLHCLPCGGCSYCQKKEDRWRDFENNVNDVVELSSIDKPELSIQSVSVSPEGNNSDNDEIRPWDDHLVRSEQEKDDDIQFLSKWLSDASEPEYASLCLPGRNKKFNWSNRDRFKMSEGIITIWAKKMTS